ncbi:MAG: creatininase family protein [Calditrichaeota bacterium]|nr:creatininase family protein [Calditrichota bacterium]
MNLLADLSWYDIQEYLTGEDRLILPLGAVEEHGPHLGVGTDFIEAEAIALGVGKATDVMIAPTLNYGMSLSQMGFAGTISLRPATLTDVLEDILHSLHQHGFRRILIVNGHGGNTASIASAVQTAAMDLPGLQVKNFQWWTDEEAYRVIIETLGEQTGSHASLGETAFMLAVRPQAVKMGRLTGRDAPVLPSRELTTVQNFAKLYPDGIMGLNPAKATKEAGEALLKKCIEICAKELKQWQ